MLNKDDSYKYKMQLLNDDFIFKGRKKLAKPT